MKSLLLTFTAVLFCSAVSFADGFTVYIPAGMDAAAVQDKLTPLRNAVPDADCNFVHLPAKCSNMHEAVQTAKAIRAGVTELPSLVLADEEGEYAAVPLRNLTDESLSAARAVATDEQRKEKTAIRRFQAKEYLLFARLGLAQPLSDEIIALSIVSCRTLMAHEIATEYDKQLLGFRCLYPLLMLQYTNGYKGAHTPASEAKLLEAITALEAARDLNKDSELGKAASEERERLRMARRKARQYE